MRAYLIRSLSVFTFLVLSSSLVAKPAHAFDLGVVGGLNSASQSYAEVAFGSEAGARATFAFGALLNFSIFPMLSIEAGALYSAHKTGTSTAFIETQNLVFPVMARYWILPIFSIGVGPYWGAGFGRIRSVGTGTTGTDPIVNDVDYVDSAYSKSDFGAAASVDLSFPIAPGLNILGDARTYLGLNDHNTSGGGPAYKVRFTQLLAGIQFTY